MITPYNIVRHELIGLKCKVVDSKNKNLIGVEGTVVDETRNMLVIETEGKEVKVPKDVVTLHFYLKDATVEVDGRVLLARPEDRIKKKLKRC